MASEWHETRAAHEDRSGHQSQDSKWPSASRSRSRCSCSRANTVMDRCVSPRRLRRVRHDFTEPSCATALVVWRTVTTFAKQHRRDISRNSRKWPNVRYQVTKTTGRKRHARNCSEPPAASVAVAVIVVARFVPIERCHPNKEIASSRTFLMPRMWQDSWIGKAVSRASFLRAMRTNGPQPRYCSNQRMRSAYFP